MRILLTGAQGMLGRDLCRILAPEHILIPIDIHEVDIRQHRALVNYLRKESFDIIIHSAAYTDVDGCEQNPNLANSVNGLGTKYIAEFARDTGTELVYVSTDFIFDGRKTEPYLESDIPNPLSVYGKSKLDGERYIQELINQYYIVRTSWLFGKHGKNFVDTIIKKAEANEILRVVNDQIGSPTYSLDLAEAIGLLIKTKNYGIYHISNSGTCSWYEYAYEILKYKGIAANTKVVSISSTELDRPAKRPQYSKLNTAKYEHLTGNKLRSWQEAVKDYLLQ